MCMFNVDTVLKETVVENGKEKTYHTTIVRKLLEDATNGNKIVKRELDSQLSNNKA